MSQITNNTSKHFKVYGLGEFEIGEVIDYYDGPKQFWGTYLPNKKTYLGVATNESPGTETWIFVKLSPWWDLYEMRCNKKDLHSTYTDAVDEQLIKIILNTEKSELIKMKCISTNDYDEYKNLIPIKGEFYESELDK